MNGQYLATLALPKGKKKGQLGINDIGPVALAIGIAVIVVAVSSMILGGMKANTTDTNATYVLNKGLTATMTFADWFNIIVVIAVSVIVISLVLMLRFRQGGGT